MGSRKIKKPKVKTPAQRILALALRGKTLEQIAESLDMSLEDVSIEMIRIGQKMNLV